MYYYTKNKTIKYENGVSENEEYDSIRVLKTLEKEQ
jgi:hypothetical protein